MRFGRCEDRSDRGKVSHLAVPSDVVSDVGEGAAQSRGSVKVLVQAEKASFDAMATEAFSSRSVRT